MFHDKVFTCAYFMNSNNVMAPQDMTRTSQSLLTDVHFEQITRNSDLRLSRNEPNELLGTTRDLTIRSRLRATLPNTNVEVATPRIIVISRYVSECCAHCPVQQSVAVRWSLRMD